MAFLKDYWEREKFKVIQLLIAATKKNPKKAKTLIRKLNATSDAIRDRIFKAYFYYKKIVYTIKFIQWRIQQLKFRNVEIEEERYEELKTLEDQYYKKRK